MSTVPSGARHQRGVLVTSGIAIRFLGREDARVLSTPNMILHMEWTARDLIKQYLDDDYDTVGTMVNVRHLAAAPIGAYVLFEAEVASQEGKRILLRVRASNGGELIGEGTHERAIIHKPTFAERLQAKRG